MFRVSWPLSHRSAASACFIASTWAFAWHIAEGEPADFVLYGRFYKKNRRDDDEPPYHVFLLRQR